MGTRIERTATVGLADVQPGNLLATGVETVSRVSVSMNNATGTGSLRLCYFTARKSLTATSSRMYSGSTAAGATPTLVRWGVYSLDAAGAGTLVASIVNDAALFATQNTAYTRALSAPLALTAGQRYAFGLLVVTGAAAPTVAGFACVAALQPELALAPRMCAALGGQADLPASFTDASLANGSGIMHYGVML